MKKIIPQSKNELLKKFQKENEHTIKFKINPEKKSQLENIVSERSVKVINVLREWIRKDRIFLAKKKGDKT